MMDFNTLIFRNWETLENFIEYRNSFKVFVYLYEFISELFNLMDNEVLNFEF